MKYDFSVVIDARSLADVPVAVSDALHEAGCDDALESSSGGVTSLVFRREADSLEQAIRSALRDVLAGLKAAGSPLRVLRVEIEPSMMAVMVPE